MRMATIPAFAWMSSYQLVDNLGRIRRCGLIWGGMSLAVGFEASKSHASTSGSDASSQLVFQFHTCLCVSMPPTTKIMGSHSETVSTISIKCLLLQVGLVIVSDHSRTVTKRIVIRKVKVSIICLFKR